MQTARELGEQLLTLAQLVQDSALLVQAYHALEPTLFWLGELATARAHLTQGIALYDPRQHGSSLLYGDHDPGVCGQSYAALTLWLLGYPDQARQRSHEALALAQELAHPFSLAVALAYAAMLHQFLRDGQAAQAQAETSMTLATEHEFVPWVPGAMILRGWARAAQGHMDAGIAQMREGLAAWEAMGLELYRTYQLVPLAEAYGKVRQTEEGCAYWNRRWRLCPMPGGVSMRQNCLGSRGNSRWHALLGIKLRQKPIFVRRSTLLAAIRPNPGNCAPP